MRYKGCILSKDMVMSGTMDKVEAFQLRDTDVIVASYPKSGTTWLQEVVYRLFYVKGAILSFNRSH